MSPVILIHYHRDNISGPIKHLAVEDIRDAQNANVATNRVLVLKRTHAHLKYKDKMAESETVRHLLREWPHFNVDGDGIL